MLCQRTTAPLVTVIVDHVDRIAFVFEHGFHGYIVGTVVEAFTNILSFHLQDEVHKVVHSDSTRSVKLVTLNLVRCFTWWVLKVSV